MCILHLGENGLEKYRPAKRWEQFKIVLLFMDHPVSDTATSGFILGWYDKPLYSSLHSLGSPEIAVSPKKQH